MELTDDQITERIISSAFSVHKKLGKGFLEKVYENAMVIELHKSQLNVQQQVPIKVLYDDRVVGEYFADLLVENKIICELKSVERLSKQHEVQLVNYLSATNIHTGLLINFADSVIIKRKFREYKAARLKPSC